MNRNDEAQDAATCPAATWQGATREAMRRWAKLPLERVIAVQDEMWELAEALNEQADPSP